MNSDVISWKDIVHQFPIFHSPTTNEEFQNISQTNVLIKKQVIIYTLLNDNDGAIVKETVGIRIEVQWMMSCAEYWGFTLLWRHNGHDNVSNHQHRDCLLNRLFRRRSKQTSKIRVAGLCAGNSPGTGEFPAQMASNAEKFPFDDVIMNYGSIAITSCT